MTRLAPICLACARFARSGAGGPGTCDAYPGGIPQPIWDLEVDHRRPHRRDHGLQFAQRDAAALLFAEATFQMARALDADGDEDETPRGRRLRRRRAWLLRRGQLAAQRLRGRHSR